MHEDMNNDIELICKVLDEKLNPIITVIKQMLDKMGLMDEELDSLAKLVNEEIIGGITNLYNTKERLSGISGLSSKYGEMFSPYKDFYSELTDGSDIYEKLYDELSEVKKGSESWSDDDEMNKIKEIAEMLKGKFDKIRGVPAATEIEVEVTKEMPEVEEKKEEDPLVERIRRMKNKAGNVKFN